MIEGAIHNPSRPQHFMQVDRMDQKVQVKFGDLKIADTDRALRLQEVGRRIYQPQYYIPREDVPASLRKTEKSTLCPLKGHASYYSLVDDAGEELAEELGWSYEDPFEFAEQISGYIAFDPRRVTITVEAAKARRLAG
ncbi:DUF427 domain-containing protein [Nitratireductor sp. XY-223]|uniref:DUF427 domain-containing protein n=1 Tax=Nitratireductor sp. XY-223 TaxID=2561926 RepID=UPI001981DF43|nr:DUF427 domain-containing protein [Nitratireductor sp. XY-223]